MEYKLEPQSILFLPPHGFTESELLQRIEVCGRVAYRSEDRITDDSAEAFVKTMLTKGHYSVLEHGQIVISMRRGTAAGFLQKLGERAIYHPAVEWEKKMLVGGNLRAWMETLGNSRDGLSGAICVLLNDAFPLLGDYSLPFTVFASEKDLQIASQTHAPDLALHTAFIRCDRGISHELVRHRAFSFTQESTRYVRYGNTVPSFYQRDHISFSYNWIVRDSLEAYEEALENGESPQIARDYLPNCLMTTVAMTGRRKDWDHFVALRDSPAAHPRIRELAQSVKKHFEG